MLRLSRRLRGQWDPDKLRGVKKLFAQHREALDHGYNTAMGREGFLDVDEQGPALFMGHMNRGLRDIQRFSDRFDFVIEMRDARLPFTTGSSLLDDLGEDKPRLIVFNKADLANSDVNKMIQSYLESQGQYALFTNAKHTWKDTVEAVIKFTQFVLPRKEYEALAHVGCLVGMPNVGKTTLLNSLRLAHHHEFHRPDMRVPTNARAVGMTPGTTRVVSMVHLCRDPPVVAYDTPGLIMPQASNRHQALKLAAVGILECNAVTLTHGIVSRYIYGVIEASGALGHLAECLRLPRPPVSYDDCTHLLAERSGAAGISVRAMTFTEAASHILIDEFRRGKLGRITLDSIPAKIMQHAAESAHEQQVEEEEATGYDSDSQQGVDEHDHHQQQQEERAAAADEKRQHPSADFDFGGTGGGGGHNTNNRNPGQADATADDETDNTNTTGRRTAEQQQQRPSSSTSSSPSSSTVEQNNSVDETDYMYTHDVETVDVLPPHPPAMADVMERLYRPDIVHAQADAFEKFSRSQQNHQQQQQRERSSPSSSSSFSNRSGSHDDQHNRRSSDDGIISRKKGPIADHRLYHSYSSHSNGQAERPAGSGANKATPPHNKKGTSFASTSSSPSGSSDHPTGAAAGPSDQSSSSSSSSSSSFHMQSSCRLEYRADTLSALDARRKRSTNGAAGAGAGGGVKKAAAAAAASRSMRRSSSSSSLQSKNHRNATKSSSPSSAEQKMEHLRRKIQSFAAAAES